MAVCTFATSVIRVLMSLMMEAASGSETLMKFYQAAPQNIPEDSHLHARCCENLISHKVGYKTLRVSHEIVYFRITSSSL